MCLGNGPFSISGIAPIVADFSMAYADRAEQRIHFRSVCSPSDLVCALASSSLSIGSIVERTDYCFAASNVSLLVVLPSASKRGWAGTTAGSSLATDMLKILTAAFSGSVMLLTLAGRSSA